MPEQVLWREPIQIAAGDTLTFTRRIPAYPAGAGWGLTYELTSAAGPAIQFQSVASGNDHAVTVAAAVTALWVSGEYVLTGYAVNVGSAERFQVFFPAPFIVLPNTATGGVGVAQPTHCQKMITSLEATLEQMAQDDLQETSIAGTQFRSEKREDIKKLLNIYYGEHQVEVDRQRSRDGLPNRNKIRMRLRVMSPGMALGTGGFGAGYDIGFGNWP
jgi:hypothetical protein